MIKWELKKLLKPTWIIIVLGLVASIWVALMYFASVSGEQHIVERFFSYWSILGSLTFGGIILFVNTKLFSLDSEHHIKEVVLATKYGKSQLLAIRFCTIIIFTTIIFCLLTLIQIVGLILFTGNLEAVWNEIYISQLFAIFIGSELFAIFAACLCIVLSSHTVTITVCSFLYGWTYILRTKFGAEEISFFTFYGVLERGFFSYLMRADFKANISLSSFSIWYGLLMTFTILLMLTIQSRRHEL